MNRCWLLLLLLFPSCEENYSARPTFEKSLYAVISPEEFELVPFPKGEAFSEGWELFVTEHEIGLNVPVPQFSDTKVIDLPHRVPKPNSAFWYRKTLNLEPGMLVLNADDGGQVWVNGERRPNFEGEVFPITESGEVEVTIRVINNAMSGGLRSVRWVSESVWESYQKKLWSSGIQDG